ncbi:hypothetical protein [Streptomyces sp. MZ04]|uniref:hypothetical protein n=1 Tax=Streptomyces sp. MZ04 TaxID=2559236 RepID=UPI001ADF8E3A|nr:hypothetical protein [Streptomyces sp. MZ04]
MDDSDAPIHRTGNCTWLAFWATAKGPIVGESERAASYIRREVVQTAPGFIQLPRCHKPVYDTPEQTDTVACLLAGSTTSTAAAVKRLTGTTVSNHNVSTLLADLTRRDDCTDALHTLILLADHLDAHGAPLDYARRRALFTPRSHWTHGPGTIPSAARTRSPERHQAADSPSRPSSRSVHLGRST